MSLFLPKNQKVVQQSRYSNPIVFGKNPTENIVSVENIAKTQKFRIYTEKNGKVSYFEQDSVFWLITHELLSDSQYELAGDQFYKYIAYFNTQAERDKICRQLKTQGHDFYRCFDQKEQSLIFNGFTYYKGLTPTSVRILSTDIETNTLKYDPDRSKILIIANTFRANGKIIRRKFCLDDYKGNELAMIKDWCAWVREMDPSIIVGHNILPFDLPYLDSKMFNLRGKLALGRDGSPIVFDKWTTKKRKDATQNIEFYNSHIFGREIIDTMFLSINYDFKREFPSYGLKPIIKHLGLEKQGRTFVDASKIGEYYERYMSTGDCPEWLLSKQYAEEDSDDALKLYDKMVTPYFLLGQSVGKSFQQMINSATGSQVNNMMIRAYLQQGHSIAKASLREKFQGAISFGIAGIYHNCLKVDVSSLYPSIMRQYEIFCKEKDPQKIFLQMVEYFTVERLKNKKLYEETKEQYYSDLSEAFKIAINSMYGFLGASGLNYNYPEGAALVTAKGREVLAIATQYATGKSIDYWIDLSNTDGHEEVEDEGFNQEPILEG